MPAKIPHDPITHRPVHITYRLAGSIPKHFEEQLARRRDLTLSVIESEITGLPQEIQAQERVRRKFQAYAQYELQIDKALHSANADTPMFLQAESAQKIILNSWVYLQEQKEIYIYAVCVMGNHVVHAVVRAPDNIESVHIGSIMRRHKSFTALKINSLLGRTGDSLWTNTYFDRRVRDGKFNTVMWYVLNNPVKPGLVLDWRDWTGTYLNPEFNSLFR